MARFIDIHAHLDHLDAPEEAIENAVKAGLAVVITNGLNPRTNRISLQHAKKHSIVRPALGIYPGAEYFESESMEIDDELKFIEKSRGKIVAIGEVGLDFSRADEKEKERQKVVFRKVIRLAKKIHKPIIVHSRKAEAEVIGMLEEEKFSSAILHCFSGRKSLVKKALDIGLMFSIPTNVVRSQQFQQLAEAVPTTSIFFETDSPYLSPFEGKKNEPAFVVEAYKKTAEIKRISLEEMANIVMMNYIRVFGQIKTAKIK